MADIEARFPDMADPMASALAMTAMVRSFDRQPIYVSPKAAPELVDEARSRLVFPMLQPAFSPSSPWTFVYVPTALWLDGETLRSQSASAEVPGLRVTVTAEPREVRWDTGDGVVVVCPLPGRRPNPGVSGDRGDCTHVWSWPSTGGRPGNAYEVTATVLWHVTWTAEGAPGGGDLGVIPQRSGVLRVPVAEIQVLNTPPPS
jgi:hypothetical protein